jgi:hypothetical protein
VRAAIGRGVAADLVTPLGAANAFHMELFTEETLRSLLEDLELDVIRYEKRTHGERPALISSLTIRK